MSEVVIIKYNAGNIGSVANALKRQEVNYLVSDDPVRIQKADKVIFPGVGEAGSTMRYLEDTGLGELIKSLSQPVLGICLGMQLMCSFSEEGSTSGLGIFSEKVKLFRVSEKVPHTGWNSVSKADNHLFDGLSDQSWFYFIHSYYAEPGESTIAFSEHGISFAACLKKDNFYAVQFHPEKSGETGARLLRNFLSL